MHRRRSFLVRETARAGALLCLLAAAVSARVPYNATLYQAPLTGGVGTEYFTVDVYVGSPPQRQQLIVDTGSSVTLMACAQCGDKCGQHEDAPFDPKQSSTYNQMTCDDVVRNYKCPEDRCTADEVCTYQMRYLEDSKIYSQLGQDVVLLGQNMYDAFKANQSDASQYAVRILFGCNTEEQGLVHDQKADGILALGAPKTDTHTPPNVIDESFAQHQDIDESHGFSVCLGIRDGYMQIGGFNTQKHTGTPNNLSITYRVPRIDQQYQLRLSSIAVGWVVDDDEQSVLLDLQDSDLNGGAGVFIDSGSTLSYATQTVYDAVASALMRYCSAQNGDGASQCAGSRVQTGLTANCWQLDDGDQDELPLDRYYTFFDSFPPISLVFDDVERFTWDPKYYLYEVNKNVFCLSILPVQGKEKKIVLGQSFMRQNDIYFDREQQRVRIVSAKCAPDVFGVAEEDLNFAEKVIKEIQSNKVAEAFIIIAFIFLIGFIGYFVYTKVMEGRYGGDGSSTEKKSIISKKDGIQDSAATPDGSKKQGSRPGLAERVVHQLNAVQEKGYVIDNADEDAGPASGAIGGGANGGGDGDGGGLSVPKTNEIDRIYADIENDDEKSQHQQQLQAQKQQDYTPGKAAPGFDNYNFDSENRYDEGSQQHHLDSDDDDAEGRGRGGIGNKNRKGSHVRDYEVQEVFEI